MDERDLMLNRLAQDLVPIEKGRTWFEHAADADRLDILSRLAHFCWQARPTREEVGLAVERANLKKSYTPCVIVTKSVPSRHTFERVAGLPLNEQIKSFLLLVAVLNVADGRRRRESCSDGCTHEWHNLPDQPS